MFTDVNTEVTIMEREPHLTPAEWSLMEYLWESAPRSGRDCVERLKDSVGWSRSTTLTMLRRMTEKGLLSCREMDGVLMYTPLLQRQDAASRETSSFLDRVYRGSVSLMISALTQKQALSQDEIDELYAILQEAQEVNHHD